MASKNPPVIRVKNINSKLLQSTIHDAVTTARDEYLVTRPSMFSYDLDYLQMSQYIEMFMADLVDQGKICQHDVICDHRNNPAVQVKNGVVKVLLKYRQRNCLNWSEIEYTFTI